MDLSGAQAIIAIILGIFGVLTIVVAAIVVVRASYDKGTIEVFRQNNEALKESDVIKTKQIEELETKNHDLEERVVKLETQNEILLRQRPSAEAIAELHEMLTEHPRDLHNHHEETMALIRETRA